MNYFQKRIFPSKRRIGTRFTINRSKPQIVLGTNSSQMPSILALDKMYNQTLSRKRKCYWLLVILFSIGFTGWQVGTSLSRFLKKPISTSVTTEPLQIIKYPTITICKDYSVFYTCVKDRIKDRKLKNSTISSNIWNEMWEYCGIQSQDIDWSIPCNIAVNVTECYYQHQHNISLIYESMAQTIFGQCIDLTPKQAFKNDPDRATRVYWKLFINYDNHVIANYRNDILLYYNLVLRENVTTSSYSIFYQAENIFNKKETFAYFSKKEYRYLHTTTNPCQSEVERAKCKTICLTNLLDQKLTCKLLYMKSSKLDLCRTYRDYVSTVATIRNFFYSADFDNCNCLRACNFVEYQIVRTYSIPDDEIVIVLRIQDKVNEIISEYYSYSFTSFVSDSAGNLGFFLGASLFGIMEILEAFVVKILKH